MVSEYLEVVEAVTQEDGETLSSEPYAKIENDLNAEVSERVEVGEISPRSDMRKGWEEKGVWPIPVLSELYGNDRLARDMVYITDSRGFSRFDPPRTYEEVRKPQYAYFAGVAAGDGGFNGENVWSVVDGGRDFELDDSRRFIDQIADLINSIFGIPHESISAIERGNKIDLRIGNKWFCRFLQNCLGLPSSYKKGGLSKPSLFDGKELSSYFWRGVFDTDGTVGRKSYRMSVSSATKSFLETAKEDLQDIGLEIKGIRGNSSGSAFDLEVETSDLEVFAKEVGFSHPRKKRILLEKLRKGARNYVYDGRKEPNIIDEEFYDLTEMDGLRVMGVGDYLLDAREEQTLYQREMADKLGVSENQIYCWENEKCAMPVDVFVEIRGDKSDALEVISMERPKFKAGVRGRDCSLVNLPLRTSSEVDRIASNAVASEREMRIRRRKEDVAGELENLFGAEIIRSERKFYTKHRTVIEFFKTFYSYQPKFPEYSREKIKELENRLEIPA